jgi:hypothetical protein
MQPTLSPFFDDLRQLLIIFQERPRSERFLEALEQLRPLFDERFDVIGREAGFAPKLDPFIFHILNTA